MGFLKSFPPPKKSLNMPISHFTHKSLAPDQFLRGVKICAEHFQHLSDIDRLLKQI